VKPIEVGTENYCSHPAKVWDPHLVVQMEVHLEEAGKKIDRRIVVGKIPPLVVDF
jgi:hypothetical protein